MPAKGSYICNGTATNALAKGWKLTLAKFWPLLVVVIIVVIADVIGEIGDYIGPLFSFFSLFWTFLISAPLQVGASWVFLQAVRKRKFIVSDIFEVFRTHYWNAVGASILTFLAVICGLVLLIVPGIIVGVRLSFVNFLVIDKKLGPVEAIKASWQLTKGKSWNIFGLFVLSVLIFIAGLLVFVVGMFFSLVWITAALAVYYHTLTKKQKVVKENL